MRFYEQKGLLTPMRFGSRRLYDARQLTRLEQILAGKRLGLQLHEIERLIAKDASALSHGEILAQIAHLEAQRDAIDAALAKLRSMLPDGE